MAAIVATVLAQGARKSVWFCGGVIIGDLTWLDLSLSGLALIAQQIPIVFVAVKWAGIAYLALLAWKVWHYKLELGHPLAENKQRSPFARTLAGFAVTMGNPKAMLFYVALLPNLINAEHMSIAAVFPFFPAVVVVSTTVSNGGLKRDELVNPFLRKSNI